MSWWLALSLLLTLCAAAALTAALAWARQRAGLPVGCRRLFAHDPAAQHLRHAPIDVAHKLSVVLPVKIHSHHAHSELERVRRLLLPSFSKFFAREDLHEILVIAPPADVEAVRAGLEPFADDLSLTVLCDDDVAPRVRGMKRGWRKQQILKLAIASSIRTPWYLAVDSDNLLVRPAGLREIAPNGVPLLAREPFEIHPGWYRGSARVLRYPVRYQPGDAVLGVTPQVLHTEVCRDLFAEIERRNRAAPWEAILARRKGWSEYSLYWLFLTTHRDVHAYYDLTGPALHDECIWHDVGEFDDAFVKRVFEDAGAPFTVVQSRIADLSVAEIHARVRPYLESPALRPVEADVTRRRCENH